MAKEATNNPYYVYCLRDKGAPFYVGMSRRRNRFSQHISEARSPRRQHSKNDIISSILADGRRPEFKIIHENLSAKEALRLEIQAIASLGRRSDNGCLVNVTPGGGHVNVAIIGPKKSFTLSRPQHVFLKEEATRLGITVSDLIRRIIDEYREKK